MSNDIIPPPPTAEPPARSWKDIAIGAKPLPPEWPLEKLVRRVGKGPAAVKRVLDRLAAIPWLKLFFVPFTSVWLGISLLFLIGVYVGIGSGFASLRAKMEMTDLQFFDAWPMQLLIAALAVNLTIVTLRRIPLTLFKLGVWTVHIGILTLLAGCVWYFSQKTEGSVRVYLNQSVDACYDVTERALYAYAINADGTVNRDSETMTRLPKLPIYFEHISGLNNPLDMALPASTLAMNPALGDATLKVVGYYPYAGLENEWEAGEETAETAATSPAATGSPGGHGVLVNFTANGFSDRKWFVAGSPAARVYDGPQMPFGIEYIDHPTAEQLADIQASFNGPLGLTVRIGRESAAATYSVEEGKPIEVGSNFPTYVLTPGEQMPMPVISKGYEGAFSNNLMVHVVRKDPDTATGQMKETAFDRMVLARYPEISPDFVTDAAGKQKRIQARVDHNLQLTFHDAQRDQIWIVERGGETGGSGFELFHRRAGGGKVERLPMPLTTPVEVQVGSLKMRFTTLEETEHAIEVAHPRIVPPAQRERGQTAMDAMQFSVVELAFSRGQIQDKHLFVPFVQFAQIGEPPAGRQPTIMNVPGVGKIGFILSTTRRELPTTIKLADFAAVKYPGAANSYEDYVSTLDVTDKTSGAKETLVARLNDPAASHGEYYFQSGWDGHDDAAPGQRFSILGVGNRPGLHAMLIGALLIIVGIGYSFYVKPILLNAKKKSLAAWAAAQKAGRGNGAPEVR